MNKKIKMTYLRYSGRSATVRKVTVFGMLVASTLLFVRSGNTAEVGLDYSLVAPQRSSVAGTPQALELVIINRLPHEATPSLPSILNGTIIDGSDRWPVQLTVDFEASKKTISPGGFALIPLSFHLPEGISGRVEIAVNEPVVLRAVLGITASAPADEANTGPANEILRRSSSGADGSPLAIDQLTRYYSKKFGLYEPMYILYGFGTPAAKFQLSFKYHLFVEDSWLAQQIPLMENFNIAYTQRTLWAIEGDSNSFYDTSYMPEIGFQFFAAEPELPRMVTWLGWQVAVQHESNGRSGFNSRGLNTLFVRAAFTIGDLDGWHLTAAPRLFTYLSAGDENRDIADYRGYGELRLVLAKHGGLALSVSGALGKDFDHGYTQIDFTIPTRLWRRTGASFFHIQYWTGYGENLLDYNKSNDAVRLGVSLVR